MQAAIRCDSVAGGRVRTGLHAEVAHLAEGTREYLMK
jgi:hypothetical protein